MLNPNEPLWLPRGSIRSILSLLIVIPVVVLALNSGIVLTGDQFVGLVSLVLTAYFVQKGRAAS